MRATETRTQPILDAASEIDMRSLSRQHARVLHLPRFTPPWPGVEESGGGRLSARPANPSHTHNTHAQEFQTFTTRLGDFLTEFKDKSMV